MCTVYSVSCWSLSSSALHLPTHPLGLPDRIVICLLAVSQGPNRGRSPVYSVRLMCEFPGVSNQHIPGRCVSAGSSPVLQQGLALPATVPCLALGGVCGHAPFFSLLLPQCHGKSFSAQPEPAARRWSPVQLPDHVAGVCGGPGFLEGLALDLGHCFAVPGHCLLREWGVALCG